MRLALYQPDIPQNAGAMMRLGACFKVPVDVIEPCGFPFDDRRLKRTAMDYGAACEVVRHAAWEDYLAWARAAAGVRLVLLTTAGAVAHTDFAFRADDTLLLGRESRGVPDSIRAAADAAVRIPIAAQARSLNVTTAAAIVLAEAFRQLGYFHGKTML
jgi:tRNA (cytidine/uridine-2'-O-)-methyltransferase